MTYLFAWAGTARGCDNFLPIDVPATGGTGGLAGGEPTAAGGTCTSLFCGGLLWGTHRELLRCMFLLDR
ncbi:MAG: hypothetical protein QGG50_08470 [Methanopyri archaeon]|nr:hypothetical protein [Methanopyri archaeon]